MLHVYIHVLPIKNLKFIFVNRLDKFHDIADSKLSVSTRISTKLFRKLMKFMVRHKDHLQDIRNTTGNHSEAERKLTSLVKHVVLSAKANEQMLQNATKEYLGNYLR